MLCCLRAAAFPCEGYISNSHPFRIREWDLLWALQQGSDAWFLVLSQLAVAANLSLVKSVPLGWSRGTVAPSLAARVALRCVCSPQVCPVLQSKSRASQGSTVWREIASGGLFHHSVGIWRKIFAFIFLFIYLLLNGGCRMEYGPGTTFSPCLSILPAARLEGGFGLGDGTGLGIPSLSWPRALPSPCRGQLPPSPACQRPEPAWRSEQVAVAAGS